MLTIALRFPTGKWHATPWGRQVNEGAVEWPPAPWRILRSLLAVWHQKCHEVPETEMRELITLLASELPVYQLPHTSSGHTRHYMPIAGENKTKIFDTFLTVSPQAELLIHWPVLELSAGQRSLLDRLLRSLSYLGRAESWVIAELGEWRSKANAMPFNGQEVQEQQELVRLLVADSVDYAQWRQTAISEKVALKMSEKQAVAIKKGKSAESAKLNKKEQDQIAASIPEDLFAALHLETSELRKAGWNRPPASQWVSYVREKQEHVSHMSSSDHQPENLPTVARYAIAGAVRPKLTEALFLAERVRQGLLKWSDGESVFHGRCSDTDMPQPATGHQHAHIFCESNEDCQNRITHVTVFAQSGFNASAVRALRQFSKTWGNDGHNLQYVLIGLGEAVDFGGTNKLKGQCPILAESTHWISATPFVPADRLRQKYNLKDDVQKARCEKDIARIIRKELSRRNWLEQQAVHLESTALLPNNTQTTWLKFRRTRTQGGGQKGNGSAFGLQLTFSQSVRGPIALGYGSHFSLGVFIPDK